MNDKIFCLNCEEEANYVLRDEIKTVTVKGLSFNVKITNAYCANCGEQVFPDKIAKQNDLIVYDEYRRLNNLLTSEEIKAIRKKRGLSQTDLARLIDCGDKNIARYETGTIQDKAFDLLMRLVDIDATFDYLQRIHKEKTNVAIASNRKEKCLRR